MRVDKVLGAGSIYFNEEKANKFKVNTRDGLGAEISFADKAQEIDDDRF